MTLLNLAGKTGISLGYLSDVERGKSDVTREKLLDIAAALGVDVSSLLGSKIQVALGRTLTIPIGLSEFAEESKITFSQTLQLLRAKQVIAGYKADWEKDKWEDFHESVKEYFTT